MRLIKIIIAFFVAMLFAAASHSDYQAAVLQERQYCLMVQQGHWPDYEHKFEFNCNPDGTLKEGDDYPTP